MLTEGKVFGTSVLAGPRPGREEFPKRLNSKERPERRAINLSSATHPSNCFPTSHSTLPVSCWAEAHRSGWKNRNREKTSEMKQHCMEAG